MSAEWFAYAVLFTPMIFLLRRVRTLFLAMSATVLLAAMALATPLLGKPWTSLDTRGALRILPEFLCGYLLYRFVRGRKLPGDGLTMLGLLLLLGVCFLRSGSLWLLVPAVMVLLAGLHAGGPVTDRVFGNRFAVLLGEASYSIYLLQNFVLIATKQVVQRMHLSDTAPVRIALVLTVLFVSGASGVLCFRSVEEPLRVWILRRFGRRRNPERKSGSSDDTAVSATAA